MSVRAMNFSSVRKGFKDCCDHVFRENCALIVTRKNDENVVLLSEDEYNRMLKAVNNATYLAMLRRSEQEAAADGFISKSITELEAMSE